LDILTGSGSYTPAASARPAITTLKTRSSSKSSKHERNASGGHPYRSGARAYACGVLRKLSSNCTNDCRAPRAVAIYRLNHQDCQSSIATNALPDRSIHALPEAIQGRVYAPPSGIINRASLTSLSNSLSCRGPRSTIFPPKRRARTCHEFLSVVMIMTDISRRALTKATARRSRGRQRSVSISPGRRRSGRQARRGVRKGGQRAKDIPACDDCREGPLAESQKNPIKRALPDGIVTEEEVARTETCWVAPVPLVSFRRS
jgi:hypothetical protein